MKTRDKIVLIGIVAKQYKSKRKAVNLPDEDFQKGMDHVLKKRFRSS